MGDKISNSFDINIIPGNVLENAIEAARQTEEKYLSVTIQFKKGILRIKIENSFNRSISFQKDDKSRILHLETTKKDKRKNEVII